MSAAEPTRPCFGCGHVHDPESPGRCWEAACLPTCPEHTPAAPPFTYTPDSIGGR